MLVDFCHPIVRPQIKCDKVSFDGYEVTNLISDNYNVRRKGFIADHFIKPPVNITLQFPCNISIYRIIIDPVIGQQQSCDLKLFSASQPGLDPWLSGDNPSTHQRNFKTDGLLFNFIGSSIQTSPALTCYQNNLFKDRGYWNREGFESVNSFPATFELRGKKQSCLFNVSHLSVNVYRTKGGKAVAIKKIEVWGMPSRNVPDTAQQILRYACQKHGGGIPGTEGNLDKQAKSKIETTCRDNLNVSKTESNPLINNVIYGDVQVPDDFLDQITFEIMAVPMLLPSGKNVDQSTLERFVNIEASWGRHPSDPFTGVTLGQGNKAIPNAALKARIDQFVIQHSEKLTVPRTLGKGPENTSDTFRSSNVVSTADTGIKCESPCKNNRFLQDRYGQRSSLGRGIINQRKRKSDQQHTTDSDASKKFCSKSGVSHLTNYGKQNSYTYTDSKTVSVSQGFQRPLIVKNMDVNCDPAQENVKMCKTVQIDHSKSLSNSLESALLSTLTSLPSFTKYSKKKDANNEDKPATENTCCNCSQYSEMGIYRLPCQHIICRRCLTETARLVACGRCCRQFNSKDVVRVFV